MNLTNHELKQITGDGYGIWAVLGGLLAFLISAVEGFINPIECGKW